MGEGTCRNLKRQSPFVCLCVVRGSCLEKLYYTHMFSHLPFSLSLPPPPPPPSLQSHSSLELLASITGKTVTAIMEPHREILADMIPPKKHLLKHQPISTQIALMDGNTFCTSLSPRLFSINLSIPSTRPSSKRCLLCVVLLCCCVLLLLMFLT